MYGPAVPWPLLSVSHRICTAVLNDNTFIKPQKYVLILKCIKCKRTRKEEKHFCNLLFADLPYFYSKHESNIIHGNTSSALLNSSLFLYIYFAPSYFLPLKFCNVHKQTAMRKKKKTKMERIKRQAIEMTFATPLTVFCTFLCQWLRFFFFYTFRQPQMVT